MEVSRMAEQLARELEHVGLEIRIRLPNGPGCDLSTERRRGLDREGVRGDVVGLEGDRLLERAPPGAERLPLGAVDQVQVDVRDAGLPRRSERAPHGLRRV